MRSTTRAWPVLARLSGIGWCASGAGMPGMGLPWGQVLGIPRSSASFSSTTGDSACSRRCASSGALAPPHTAPRGDPPRPCLGHAEALGGEADLLLAVQPDIAVLLHAPERLGDGGRRQVHVAGEARADHRLLAARQVVDRAEIVLDRGSGFHAARI